LPQASPPKRTPSPKPTRTGRVSLASMVRRSPVQMASKRRARLARTHRPGHVPASLLKTHPQVVPPRRNLQPKNPPAVPAVGRHNRPHRNPRAAVNPERSEEHTSELQSRENLVCRLLLEKKKANI